MPRACISFCICCKMASLTKHSTALLDALSVIWQATCCRLPSSDHMKYCLLWIRTFPQYDQLVSHVCYDIIPRQLYLPSTFTSLLVWGLSSCDRLRSWKLRMFRIKFWNQLPIWLSETAKYLYNCPYEEKSSYMVWKCSTDWNIS